MIDALRSSIVWLSGIFDSIGKFVLTSELHELQFDWPVYASTVFGVHPVNAINPIVRL